MTSLALDTSAAALNGVLAGDNVSIVSNAAVGSIAAPTGTDLPVTFTGFGLTGSDALNYTLAFGGTSTGSTAGAASTESEAL